MNTALATAGIQGITASIGATETSSSAATWHSRWRRRQSAADSATYSNITNATTPRHVYNTGVYTLAANFSDMTNGGGSGATIGQQVTFSVGGKTFTTTTQHGGRHRG